MCHLTRREPLCGPYLGAFTNITLESTIWVTHSLCSYTKSNSVGCDGVYLEKSSCTFVNDKAYKELE